MPIAISFLTFHALSYIIDVYQHKLAPTRSLVDILLYISFFPHLVAGPIVRAKVFLEQTVRQVGSQGHPARPERLSDRRRPVQEGHRGELSLDRFRRRRVSQPDRLFAARPAARHVRLRAADLLRLFRLYRHRDRDRQPARLPVPAELQPALSRALGAGFLAPLAHHAVDLAARLSLHPARRQPRRQPA